MRALLEAIVWWQPTQRWTEGIPATSERMALGWQNRHWMPASAWVRWLKAIGWSGAAWATRRLSRMAAVTRTATPTRIRGIARPNEIRRTPVLLMGRPRLIGPAPDRP